MKSHGKKSTSRIEFSIYCLAICLFGNVAYGAGRTRRSALAEALAELQTQMHVSDSDIVVPPGVYVIDAAGVAAGEYGNPFMLIAGDNNTWDFTGVTFAVNTDFYRAHGMQAVQILQVSGKRNHVKGLTIQDVGDLGPILEAQLVTIDGVENTLEACTIMAKGSTPYGYGDMLGKGVDNLTSVHKKSCLKIGGERIDVVDCTIISRAFGHGIIIGGAVDTLIAGTTIEGELRETSDILMETSGPAFDAGFVNRYDQPNMLQPGWTLSLQQDGIRAIYASTRMDLVIAARWNTGHARWYSLRAQ